MKKLFYAIILLLIIPVVVNAKTVTCTSTINLVVGKEVGDAFKVKCSEGKVEPFAVTVLNSGYIMSDELAESGKTYLLDFVWTGTLTEGDKIVVDGKDQSEFAMFCEDGCHLTTKNAKAKADNSTTPTTPDPDEPKPQEPVHVNVYWVKFDTNGGKEKIKDVAVEEGKTVAKPENPTREGYKFVEWQLNGKTYDFKTKISKTITLKAKWEEDTTGKQNISFVKLYDLSAPYSGTELDTQVTVETFDTWSIDLFNVSVDWYRGKSEDKVTEKVVSPYKHKAENGYYYQAVITLTPGNGYTLKNTKLSINGKYVKTTQDENKIIAKWNVYGPVKTGENLEPKLIIQDINDIIYKNDSYETVPVYFVVDNTFKEEIIVDGDDFIKVSNTTDFKVVGPTVKGKGLRNVITSSPGGYGEDGLLELGEIGLKHMYPGTYSTEVYFYDTQGRKYSANVTVTRKNVEAQTVKLKADSNALVMAEVLAEMDKHWMFNFTELSNLDNGQKTYDNGHLSELGGQIEVYKISISNDEDGELKNASVTIKIPLTDEITKYKNHSFIYVSEDFHDQIKLGDSVKAHIEGDYLVVTLPHLSTWALVGNNEEEAITKPDSNNAKNDNKNNVLMYSSIGVAVVILGVVTFVLLKKKI